MYARHVACCYTWPSSTFFTKHYWVANKQFVNDIAQGKNYLAKLRSLRWLKKIFWEWNYKRQTKIFVSRATRVHTEGQKGPLSKNDQEKIFSPGAKINWRSEKRMLSMEDCQPATRLGPSLVGIAGSNPSWSTVGRGHCSSHGHCLFPPSPSFHNSC